MTNNMLLENRGIITCRSMFVFCHPRYLIFWETNKIIIIVHSFHTLPFFVTITATIYLNVNTLIWFWLIASLFWLKNKIYSSEFFKYLCLKCHFMLLNIMQIILEIFSYSGLCRLVTLQECQWEAKFALRTRRKYLSW